jgi:hypothetical protein
MAAQGGLKITFWLKEKKRKKNADSLRYLFEGGVEGKGADGEDDCTGREAVLGSIEAKEEERGEQWAKDGVVVLMKGREIIDKPRPGTRGPHPCAPFLLGRAGPPLISLASEKLRQLTLA